MNPVKNEPVVTAVVALLSVGGSMLAAFGVHLTDVQIALVTQFVQDALILAFVVRQQVTPKSHQPANPVADVPAVVVTPEALAAAGQ